jgi:hypothetical protein
LSDDDSDYLFDDGSAEKSAILFKNRQWAVTSYGVETVKPGAPYHYHFTADRLLESRNGEGQHYDWPVHIAEKTWVDIEAFIEVFEKALELHKGAYPGAPDPDRMKATLEAARKEARRR